MYCNSVTIPLVGKQSGPKKPAKHPDVLGLARLSLEKGRYRDTRHVVDRRQEREITLMEIKAVIGSGWHEKAKDRYQEEYSAWSYAIRGKTVDKRALRVVISFEPDERGELLLLITAIDLDA